MLVFLAEKLVFLSMPKCASSSIQEAYVPYAGSVVAGHPRLKHIDLSTYESDFRFFSTVADGPLETVCIIRDPMDHLRSWYCYLQRDEMRNTSASYREKSFDQFISAFLKKESNSLAIKTQFEFVQDKVGNVGVHRIFALEKLERFEQFMNHRRGVCPNLSRMNAYKPLGPPISSKFEAMLRHRLASDLALHHAVLQCNHGWINPMRPFKQQLAPNQAITSTQAGISFVRRARPLLPRWWWMR